jgi:drug/metabolite transporter (DMT)-like permease
MSLSAAQAHVRPKTWLVVACLISVYVVWGTTYFALKVGVQGVSPYFLIATRFLVAGGLLMAWLVLRGAPLPTLKQWGSASLLGLLLLVLGLGSVTTAEQWVSSGATVALIATMPLMMAMWSGVFGRWPRPMEWVTILLGLAGTLVMIFGQDFRVSPLGTGLILMACAAWSLGSVLGNYIDMPRGAMGFAAEMLAGGVLCAIVSLIKGEQWVLPQSPDVWGAWVYLVIAGSLIAFSAYRYLVEQVSPTLAATYAYVNPPVALFVGWWLGHESFSPNVFIGLPIVLASVGLLAWVQFRAKTTPAAPIEPKDAADASANVCAVRATE